MGLVSWVDLLAIPAVPFKVELQNEATMKHYHAIEARQFPLWNPSSLSPPPPPTTNKTRMGLQPTTYLRVQTRFWFKHKRQQDVEEEHGMYSRLENRTFRDSFCWLCAFSGTWLRGLSSPLLVAKVLLFSLKNNGKTRRSLVESIT